MEKILLIIEIIISIVLTLLILMQNKDGGLNATFGGGEGFEATKRGVEKVIFNATVILAFVFVANALALAIL